MNQSNVSPTNDQPRRQHWRCTKCGEKGSVRFHEDVLHLIRMTISAHYGQNPACGHPDAVQLYAPDFAAQPLPEYDPTEPMHVVGVTSAKFASWSPGDVENGDPLTQVHILVTVPSLQAHLLVRLKTRAMCDQWINGIISHRDEVFPVKASAKVDRSLLSAIFHVDYDEGVKGSYRGVTVTLEYGEQLEFRSGDFIADYEAATEAVKTAGYGYTMASSSIHDFMMLEGYRSEED